MEQRIINIYENYLKTKYDKKNKTIKFYSHALNGLCIRDNNYTIHLYENNFFNIYINNKIYKIYKNNYLNYTNFKDNTIIYMDNIKYNYYFSYRFKVVDSLGKLIEFIKLYKNNKLIQKNITYDTSYIYKLKYLYIYKYIYIINFYFNFKIISLRKNNIYFHIEYIII